MCGVYLFQGVTGPVGLKGDQGLVGPMGLPGDKVRCCLCVQYVSVCSIMSFAHLHYSQVRPSHVLLLLCRGLKETQVNEGWMGSLEYL